MDHHASSVPVPKDDQVTRKLSQSDCPLSIRSVQRVIEEFCLQKNSIHIDARKS